jgi:aminoglycoside phosphotransferase (APT) family kinase protein
VLEQARSLRRHTAALPGTSLSKRAALAPNPMTENGAVDRELENEFGYPPIAALRSRPSPEALSWAASAVADGGRVVSVRPLTGGISSAIHGLVVADRRGQRRRVVLRRWLSPDGEHLVDREAAALAGLAATPIPAPALVAADPSGLAAGCPALVMQWLPGRVDLTPPDPGHWLDQLVHAAADIHQQQIAAAPFEMWSIEVERGFSWSARPDAWRRAMDLIIDLPAYTPVFLHGDFQHFNVLWSAGQLAGVVDWTFAGIGPRELDTGRCRLNLAVLFSVDRAERFRHEYEDVSGHALDPLWDLYALSCYGTDWPSFIPIQVGDRGQVDVAGMHARVDGLLLSVLDRL